MRDLEITATKWTIENPDFGYEIRNVKEPILIFFIIHSTTPYPAKQALAHQNAHILPDCQKPH